MNIIKQKTKKIIISLLNVFPIKKNKVVFQNFDGKGYGDNPKYIAKEIMRQNLDIELVWLCKDMNEIFPEQIRKVKRGGLRSYYELATAKVWIDNVRSGMRSQKRKNQLYIQTWHSAYGPKQIEKDVEDVLSASYINVAKADGAMIDAILADNEPQAKQFKRAFWLKEEAEILKVGLPRIDFLIENKNNSNLIGKIKKDLGIKKNQYVILYAPTFRSNDSLEPYKIDFNRVIDAFSRKLNRECVVVIRMHPHIREKSEIFMGGKNVLNASYYPDMQELILMSDCVITDYSSVSFDFAILNKLVMICALDLEEYRKVGRLSDEFYEFPFPLAQTNNELIKTINNYEQEVYEKKVNQYFKENPIYDDGHAAYAVVNWIKERMH